MSPTNLDFDRDKKIEVLDLARQCRQKYPQYHIINKQVTKHVLVSKTGKELLSANSFWGFIGMTILSTFLSCLAIIAFAAIVCGIANIF